MAETVNYVIQRGDLYSTLGVIAGLVIYGAAPRARRFGVYLLPVAAALLSKPPALVFPALLFCYIVLFEDAKPGAALRRCFPALIVTAALGWLTSAMTPKAFTAGAVSGLAYRITQPLVALRYFRALLIPDQLSADTDRAPVNSVFDGFAWLGFVFVIAVALTAWRCSKLREWRPSAFGLWWFLLALVPTSVFPLAEVENDHRMFFPFAGLVLAICWPAAMWLYRRPAMTRGSRAALATAGVVMLVAYALGTRDRNRVWSSDETLWYDVTLKSPHNGRGLMNYGLTQMAKGNTLRALGYFERALEYTPAYYVLDINLGIANGVLNRDAAAERYFLQAVQLAPRDAVSHYFYARWLYQKGRGPEAIAQVHQAVSCNPDHLDSRYLLMEACARQGDWRQVKEAALGTLGRFPADATAQTYLSRATSAATPQSPQSAEQYLNLSLAYHRAGRYQDAINAATNALRLKPDYAEAYNNIAAGYEAMEMWNPAIEAARRALKLRPDFQLARNNLLWSEAQRKKAGGLGASAPVSPVSSRDGVKLPPPVHDTNH
jgi:tetratricopeptide (TPR) repeat protein